MHVFANTDEVKIVAAKIQKLKKLYHISNYELALDIGISEYPLYIMLAKNKATIKTLNLTINYMKEKENEIQL